MRSSSLTKTINLSHCYETAPWVVVKRSINAVYLEVTKSVNHWYTAESTEVLVEDAFAYPNLQCTGHAKATHPNPNKQERKANTLTPH